MAKKKTEIRIIRGNTPDLIHAPDYSTTLPGTVKIISFLIVLFLRIFPGLYLLLFRTYLPLEVTVFFKYKLVCQLH